MRDSIHIRLLEETREAKPRIRASSTSLFCNVGAGDGLVHNLEPNTDCDKPPDSASSEPIASTSEKLTQIISIVTIRGGKVHESRHHSLPSLQLWCFLFIRMGKDVIQFLTKLRSSQARRLSQSLWAKELSPLAAVRHDKNSPVITAQEKTQSDVKCEITPRSSRCACLCAHLLCLHH